jgi:hypothetical protein
MSGTLKAEGTTEYRNNNTDSSFYLVSHHSDNIRHTFQSVVMAAKDTL